MLRITIYTYSATQSKEKRIYIALFSTTNTTNTAHTHSSFSHFRCKLTRFSILLLLVFSFYWNDSIEFVSVECSAVFFPVAAIEIWRPYTFWNENSAIELRQQTTRYKYTFVSFTVAVAFRFIALYCLCGVEKIKHQKPKCKNVNNLNLIQNVFVSIQYVGWKLLLCAMIYVSFLIFYYHCFHRP